MNKIKIGIVVIGRNEGSRLILCLKSVLKAQVPCIYVDSQSEDNSVQEANKLHVNTIVLDKSASVNASRARNTGFNVLVEGHNNLEYIHFIDADCELDSNWLTHAIKALDESSDIGVVCGRLHEKYKNKNIYTRLCDMDWYIKPGEIDACGGIATIRRDVFEEMQGFNEELIAGADPELYFRIRKVKYKIVCLPVDMGTHDSNMQYFSQFWRRSEKTGYAYISKMGLGVSKKPVLSALIWSSIFPLIIFILSFIVDYKFLLLFLIYPVQVLKIYIKSEDIPFPAYSKFFYSVFCVLGKFSESVGIVKYIYNILIKREQNIIEYKLK